jgi:hypothetical protein
MGGALLEASREVALEAKQVFMPHHRNAGQNYGIITVDKSF